MTTALALDTMPVPLVWAEGGRVIRLRGSRISLDLIVEKYTRGESAEQIGADYPHLNLADLHGAIAFYLHNREAVDAYLRRGVAEAEELRRRIESTPEHQAFAAKSRALEEQREREQQAGGQEGRQNGDAPLPG